MLRRWGHLQFDNSVGQRRCCSVDIVFCSLRCYEIVPPTQRAATRANISWLKKTKKKLLPGQLSVFFLGILPSHQSMLIILLPGNSVCWILFPVWWRIWQRVQESSISDDLEKLTQTNFECSLWFGLLWGYRIGSHQDLRAAQPNALKKCHHTVWDAEQQSTFSRLFSAVEDDGNVAPVLIEMQRNNSEQNRKSKVARYTQKQEWPFRLYDVESRQAITNNLVTFFLFPDVPQNFSSDAELYFSLWDQSEKQLWTHFLSGFQQ